MKDEIKINDLVVRINKGVYQPKRMVGNMHKITDNSSTEYLELPGGWRIKRTFVRKATAREMKAYKTGVRNIRDIHITVDEYSII